MPASRYWAALLATGPASIAGVAIAAPPGAEQAAAQIIDGDAERPMINPDGLHMFGLDGNQDFSPIDLIAPTADRVSAAEKRTQFEIFSFQVNQDEENAAIVAAGGFPVVPVGNGEPMKIEQVPFQVQIRYADRVTNAQAPGIDVNRIDDAVQEARVCLPAAEIGKRVFVQSDARQQPPLGRLHSAPQAEKQPGPADRPEREAMRNVRETCAGSVRDIIGQGQQAGGVS
jgi:hypothetical protein